MSSVVAPQVQKKSLEQMSDDIDHINRLRAEMRGSPLKASDTKVVNEKDFRQYQEAEDPVKGFYAEQHQRQTVEFVVEMHKLFNNRVKIPRSMWQAMETMDEFVDTSDPDTQLSQIQHLLQTSEGMRKAGMPRWMICVGAIHDLGKIWAPPGGLEQWAVVGDTFPVGCAFEDSNILPESFKDNPDSKDPRYNTKYGIYKPNCGLDNVMMSWGHDEYMYQICKEQSTLPKEGLNMIRYHSFYPFHSQGGYRHLTNEEDEKILASCLEFNPYDLYTKHDEEANVEELKPYYEELFAEFFPPVVWW